MSPQVTIGDERGPDVVERHLLGLVLPQARVQDRRHAGQPQLTESLIQFDSERA